MYPYDTFTADHHDWNGCPWHNAYPVFAFSFVPLRKAHAEICAISGEGIAVCSVWPFSNLLPEKCQSVYGKPWDTGSSLYSIGHCITFVEKADAAFYSGGNGLLYAFGAIYFLELKLKKEWVIW